MPADPNNASPENWYPTETPSQDDSTESPWGQGSTESELEAQQQMQENQNALQQASDTETEIENTEISAIQNMGN